MDRGTDYCYSGVPLALYWSLTRGLLGCYMCGVGCLLSVGSFLTERGEAGAYSFVAYRSHLTIDYAFFFFFFFYPPADGEK